MTGVVDQCLWVSPSEVSPRLAETSAQRFARSIVDRCEVVVIGLRVWGLGLSDPYDLTTEVAAVEQAAADLGWGRYHLFGFSAGATVAFATARANPRAVRTVAGFEPATIGDDDWSPVETRWRRDLARVRQLVPRQRQQACAPDLGRAHGQAGGHAGRCRVCQRGPRPRDPTGADLVRCPEQPEVRPTC